MTGRHTRTPVWLTRLRAPFATTSARELPEFDLQRIRTIRFTRPDFTGSILRRPTEPTFRAAVTLLLGITLGYGYSVMTVEAPQVCAEAFDLVDGIFEDQENYTDAVIMMKSRGQSEYEGHEARSIQLWDEIDAAKADYRDAKAACLGGAR